MQPEPVRTAEPGVLAGVPVEIRQRGPVLGAHRPGLDEEVVPVRLGVPGDVERELPAAGRDVDHPAQSLVRGVVAASDRIAVTGARLGLDVEGGIDGVPIADAVDPPVVDVELPDGGGGEIGRHRVSGDPGPRHRAAASLDVGQVAVGDDLEPAGHGDLEAVAGLVERMVVDREPGVGHVRLAHDERAVVGREHTRLAQGRLVQDQRHPAVAHHHAKAGTLGDSALRNDRELVTDVTPAGRTPVDSDLGDLQTVEVEIELRQGLGGACRDGGPAPQPVGGRVVGQFEVVVRDVIPPVAISRKVRIADAGRSRARLPRIRGRHSRRTDQSDQQGGNQDDDGFAHGLSP